LGEIRLSKCTVGAKSKKNKIGAFHLEGIIIGVSGLEYSTRMIYIYSLLRYARDFRIHEHTERRSRTVNIS
jgi:hypothetical protein